MLLICVMLATNASSHVMLFKRLVQIRGDVSDASVARDVDESLQDLKAFFAKAFAAK